MNAEPPTPPLDLRDRLNAVTAWALPDRGRFRVLQEMSGISQDTWKATWHRKQRPTSDMVQFVARAWPSCAFWLCTGITDQRHGHRAPDGADTYPEAVITVRTGAARYFHQQIEMLARRDRSEPELYEHVLQLRALEASRDLDETVSDDADALAEDTYVANLVQNLDQAAEPTTDTDAPTRPGSRTGAFLEVLQSDRQFSDAEMASLLGQDIADIQAVKAGTATLDARATARVIDSWAYDKLRDALFKVLPARLASDLRLRDIERGRRNLRRRTSRS